MDRRTEAIAISPTPFLKSVGIIMLNYALLSILKHETFTMICLGKKKFEHKNMNIILINQVYSNILGAQANCPIEYNLLRHSAVKMSRHYKHQLLVTYLSHQNREKTELCLLISLP